MSYASTGELQARYLERDLIALTDERNQAVDLERVQRALDDASAEIDSYLGMRYVLPLVDAVSLVLLATPDALVRICVDIAMYRLQTLRPTDDVKDARARYTDAIAQLKLFSTGANTIEGAALLPGQSEFPATASQSPGMAELGMRDTSVFSRRRR